MIYNRKNIRKIMSSALSEGKRAKTARFKSFYVSFKNMSEELNQKGYVEHGLKIGVYEFYQIGNTSLNELKRYKIVPNKNYKEYGARKPDALLVDRRNKNTIRVIAVIEYKDGSRFVSDNDKIKAVRQCNTTCQVLDAKVGIASDNASFEWFNPSQQDNMNEYEDESGKKRSYTLVKGEDGNQFKEEFIVNQRTDELEILNLDHKTRQSLQNVEIVKKSVNARNSVITQEKVQDPTNLAKQIWQDVWSVSGATPEKCLYTFVELFIFKYLSDLKILREDDKGNKIYFDYIFSLEPDKAFKNYSANARPYLKVMFPESKDDHTTIINGTVLNPNVPEHSNVFHKILKKFNDFGEMTNVDPAFKSKVFEAYMKEDISKKNWGQYFTPRKIVDAIIEISDIDRLPENAEICDPACGVGGFILEPMKVKNNGVSFYYKVNGNKIKGRNKFIGYDKGFEREEQLTIILAKANMLIFLSELLKNNPSLTGEFADLLNATFKLQTNTILGTLSRVSDRDKYDLILTNPPYVTSGSSNYKQAIKSDSNLSAFYKINGMGVESLFLEWIIRSLKPSRKAIVIIPDGILNRSDSKLRKFIKQQCTLDGIISLPVNTFYTTPKKTYILVITKKSGSVDAERESEIQTDPVFTYLVSDMGETLDVNRFPTDKSNLPEMVSLFNQFKGAKTTFSTTSQRCKIQPIGKFDPSEHWAVDRWWTKEEKVELGIEEEEVVLTIDEFKTKVNDVVKSMSELNDELKGLK